MRTLVLILILSAKMVYLFGQQEAEVPKSFQQIDLTASILFQNFSLPFNDVQSNFNHPGLSIGVETNLNRKQNLFLQTGFAGYLNKQMGNGFLITSQTVYRPNLFNYLHPEIKFGLGWLRSYHPVNAYEFADGEWSKKSGGKSQLIIPIGIGLEYKNNFSHSMCRPYISYQIIPNLFYNNVLPLSFYTLVEVGVKLNIK
jgi:hypothetical protein